MTLRDVEQAVEIHLVAGDGFGAGGEGGEDEGAFGRFAGAGRVAIRVRSRADRGSPVGRCRSRGRRRGVGSGWKTTRRPVIGLSSFRQAHRDVVGEQAGG